jgi:hypothetical protein
MLKMRFWLAAWFRQGVYADELRTEGDREII